MLGLGGRAGSDGKRERAGLSSLSPSRHYPRAAVFPSPQAYGQEASAEERGRESPKIFLLIVKSEKPRPEFPEVLDDLPSLIVNEDSCEQMYPNPN